MWYQKYRSNEQESPGDIWTAMDSTILMQPRVIDDYNFEDRKLVEIVKSTYFNPKVLVVDETTTALGQKGREELFKEMNRVRDTGNCVIFISHDLAEILDQSDTIRILRDGVYIGTVKSADATR